MGCYREKVNLLILYVIFKTYYTILEQYIYFTKKTFLLHDFAHIF